ncbi:MAG: C25 family cysteine peptidase [Polyangiales bacterium]
MLKRWGIVVLLALAAIGLKPAEADAQCALLCPLIFPGCNVVNCEGGFCLGTAGVDCIIGTAAGETIWGLGGGDCICGGGGADLIYGNNSIAAGPDGADFIDGEDGADFIFGQDGADTLIGGDGDDNISGGADNDTLQGDAGDDILSGDAGDDQFFGGTGADTINAGAGNDGNVTGINGQDGNDTINLNSGNNTNVNGGAGADTIFGGTGDDSNISGGADNDVIDLTLGGANNMIAGNGGDDSITGGAGNDTNISGDDGNDNIRGGGGNDMMSGGAGFDDLSGGDGDDTLSGNDDPDVLDGGPGTDTLDGGAEADTCLNGETNIDCENFTHALLASFDAFTDQGASIVRWVTSSEAGTVGFYLYREVHGEWEAVHEGLLPGLLDAPQGGVYDFRDAGANTNEDEQYLLVEVDVRGVQSEHGPFVVNFESTEQTILGDDALFGRQAHELDPIGTTLKAANTEKQSPGDAVAIYLGVEETGLYTISAAEVAARFGITEASVRDRIQMGELLLTEEGESVAWAPSADGSGLEFYGVERRSLFTTERIYRLSLDTGSTMGERSAAPGTLTGDLTFESNLHLEEDLIAAVIIAQDPDADYWFWQLISAEPSMPLTAAVTFELETIAGGGRLQVDLQGILGDAHSVEVGLNGTPLGTTSFEGVVPHRATFSVPEAALQEGQNTLSITPLSPGSSMLYLNSADVTYTRGYTTSAPALLFGADQDASLEVNGLTGDNVQVLDVSDPRQPVRLGDAVAAATGLQLATEEGRSYFAVSAEELRSPTSIWNDVPSTLQSRDNAADYLLITPAELFSEAQALADYREAEGFSTMLVELQDIYDEFAFGTPDPNAIRDFLLYTQGNWASAPDFVVLVGKGSFDYRDIRGRGGNLLPPLMVRTQDGIFSSDNTYADLLADDGLPDIAIGRLPVASAAELSSVIQQIISYEGSLDFLPDEITLLADETFPQDNFGMSSDFVSDVLPVGWNANAVYRSELGDLESTRAVFFDEVRKGPRLVNYLGHAGATALGFREVLLSVEDIETLTVDGTQPVYSNMTCTASRFAVPGLVSLGEALLLDDEAAIAVWGPSGISINAQATLLARAFVNELSTGGETRIGPMINRAYPVLADLEFGREMISIYHLFGDPALRVTKGGDPGTAGVGGDGGAGGSAGAGGFGGDSGTDGGGGGGSGCSVGWPMPSTSSVPLLLLLSAVALAWRRRRRS